MNRKWGVWFRQRSGMLVAAAFVAAMLAPSARAEDGGQPARAVRLSSVDGQVKVMQGNQVVADHAIANAPLFEGTQVVTGNDGKAELQFEDGSVARLSPDSSLTLTVLRGQGSTGSDAEVLLSSGLGYFELSGDSENSHIRIRFGDSVITASGFTVIRINLDKLPGEMAVFSGNAHLEGAGSLEVDLHGGESIALNSSDPYQYNLSESIEPDSWDTWNSDRDQALTSQAAGRTDATRSFADSNNPAWSDLDANGNWYNVPDQGYVWSPYEASNPGWDPYGTGSWMPNPQFGYIWVSGEPWGYMPYQCGAWNYYNQFGWGWAPGYCQPWWGGGGWIVNIGYAPPRYHYPNRPRPKYPRPVGVGAHPVGPEPVISVNRRVSPVGPTLPVRDKVHPITIGGTIVQPLRPIRPRYEPEPLISGNRPIAGPPASGPVTRPGTFRSTGQAGSDRPIYMPVMPAPNPGGSTAPRPVVTISEPRPTGGSYSHPTPPPAVRSPAPVSAPAPRPSGGGAPSGGGGGHPSGGGPHH